MEFEVNENKFVGELGKTIEVHDHQEWTEYEGAGVHTPVEDGFYVKINPVCQEVYILNSVRV